MLHQCLLEVMGLWVLLWRDGSAWPGFISEMGEEATSIPELHHRCFLEEFIPESGTARVSAEEQVGVVDCSVWAGCPLLIYYFFVSVEALKCRLGSNDVHEPLDSSTGGGGGVECSWASLAPPLCAAVLGGPQGFALLN